MKITITIELDEKEFMKSETEETSKESDCTVSQYARFFDESCRDWVNDSEYNLMFIRMTQRRMNDLLRSRGYLFLNDVYDALGMTRTKAGQIVGWVYDDKNTIGDNHVDFGLYSEKSKPFVNGFEKSILLDFNVDGVILDHLKTEL